MTAVALFIILFSWISFFPEPVQARYWLHARIFLCPFLLILIQNKKYLKSLFSLRDWPLWVFLICLWAGTVSASNKDIALKTYFYLSITLSLIFYIGKGLFLQEEIRNKACLIICICACLVALIGTLELYFGKNILYEKFISNPFYERYIKFNPRLMSTQLNPAVLGSFLLGCLPFSLYFLKNKSLNLRLSGILSFLLCLAVIILTFSRGSFLGLIAMLLFYLWAKYKRKAVISLLPLILVICFFSCQKDTNLNRFGFKRFISGSYDSIFSEYRIARVKMTLKILKDYPLLGIGFNHFRLRFNEYCDKNDIKEISEFRIPDNMYLTFLAEAGIIGTLGFLVFIFSLLRRALGRLNKLEEDSSRRQLLLVLLTALIGMLVNMGGYELFYWSNPYMLFCLTCGFIEGAVEKTER